ncbi:GH25 family lysozyme M1 (1,4-beta-N-acetylmuramidase) [Friedmanniella endophytica]|uniref:Lysozyme n=1 Tax=Microlunatus kandeliicorticis TaxID=1759536 RepID=A0A7W3P766_9ACTN|nr:GH25 family lysozyme M1 (1,4-beta-N-acetylmuramidase) [Microlunatus kandeliicorticis]
MSSLRRRRVARLGLVPLAVALTAGSLGLAGAGAPASAAPAGGPTRTNASALPFGSGSMGWRSEVRLNASGAQARYSYADNARTALRRAPSGVKGMDVSSWQGRVNWSNWRSAGMRFAYVKATEGSSYRNPYFSSQYTGAAAAGMLRGAYHFAVPNRSSGVTQANYFVNRGGGWTADGRTLPGVLDIEYNPYGATCYGKSKAAMVTWIRSFVVQYKKRTGRDAVIYTTADWWSRCTGNSTAFNRTNPLWVARYSSSVGTLPGKWPFYTFWQYSSSPIDQNVFSASASRLGLLARG